MKDLWIFRCWASPYWLYLVVELTIISDFSVFVRFTRQWPSCKGSEGRLREINSKVSVSNNNWEEDGELGGEGEGGGVKISRDVSDWQLNFPHFLSVALTWLKSYSNLQILREVSFMILSWDRRTSLKHQRLFWVVPSNALIGVRNFSEHRHDVSLWCNLSSWKSI